MSAAVNLTPTAAPRERRRLNRIQVIQSGQITFGETKLRCVILDLSAGGTKVQLLAAPDIFPGRVSVNLPDGTSRLARLRWRQREQARFQFVD